MVSGTVTDESGQPLPGVTVVIKRHYTRHSYQCRWGIFTLTNIPEDATLQFSGVFICGDAIGIEAGIGYGTIQVISEKPFKVWCLVWPF
jgi:TonB-dependent starch-binding outer membrane protein SusC